MKDTKKIKKIIIGILVAGLLFLVLIVGGRFLRNRMATAVDVFPMSMINQSSMVGDDYASELSGTVTSDLIQDVILDNSKTVKKIYVKKGDKVFDASNILHDK